MRILALETYGISGSVAVADDVKILREITLSAEQRSARALAPTIRQILRDVNWKPTEVELIAVTVGPGSFTGLRVGVVTAKALAYVVGCRIAAVNTLEVLARQAAVRGERLTTVLDAQRGEFFAASWTMNADGEIQPLEPAAIVSAEALLRLVGGSGRVVGPVAEKLAGQLPATVTAVAIMPQASAVAVQGFHQAQRGKTVDPFALVPQYLRRTAAEEQWEKRQAAT